MLNTIRIYEFDWKCFIFKMFYVLSVVLTFLNKLRFPRRFSIAQVVYIYIYSIYMYFPQLITDDELALGAQIVPAALGGSEEAKSALPHVK